jgi:hypothetical protein
MRCTITLPYKHRFRNFRPFSTLYSMQAKANKQINLKSKLKSRYDCRSVSQSVSISRCRPNLGLVTIYYFLSEGCCLKVAVLSLWGALSDERSVCHLSFSVSSNLSILTTRIYVSCVLQFSNLQYIQCIQSNVYKNVVYNI